MATLITKNSSTASSVPLAASLTQGELAVNVTDKKLYTKDSGGSVVKLVGSLGNQEANAVAITGGSINGTTIGGTTASTGAFTTLTTSSTVTLNGGTANGLAFLNASKVLTSGSALTFDGTSLTSGGGYKATGAVASLAIDGGTFDYSSTVTRLAAGRAGGNYATFELYVAGASGVTKRFAADYDTTFRWIGSDGTSEQMRLTSTGLGIGTSSPSAKLHVAGTGTVTGLVNSTNGGTATLSLLSSGVRQWNINADSSFRFTVDGSEIARFTGGSSLLVGTTSASAGNTFGTGILARSTTKSLASVTDASSGEASLGLGRTNSTGNYVEFYYGTALTTSTGTISTNGTTTSYNITSDQRLKENIADADSASSLIDSLQVRKFDWKTDQTHQRYGFVAQELLTVAPEAVHQPEDTEQMMSVDYSKLVPLLVKEIQSLRQRLAAANL